MSKMRRMAVLEAKRDVELTVGVVARRRSSGNQPEGAVSLN